jgi:hypothetical protein
MFDALFAAFGPMGSALMLLGVVAVLFVVAAVETLGLAAPVLRARWVSVSQSWAAAPESLRRIARALSQGDSRPRHAFSLRALVHRFRLRHRS